MNTSDRPVLHVVGFAARTSNPAEAACNHCSRVGVL